jgi:hypothetical protein
MSRTYRRSWVDSTPKSRLYRLYKNWGYNPDYVLGAENSDEFIENLTSKESRDKGYCRGKKSASRGFLSSGAATGYDDDLPGKKESMRYVSRKRRVWDNEVINEALDDMMSEDYVDPKCEPNDPLFGGEYDLINDDDDVDDWRDYHPDDADEEYWEEVSWDW